MMIGMGNLGLGTSGCTPPSIAVPINPYTTNPLEYNAPAQNCYSVSNQASITNQNLYEEWQLDANNAQLNGQPPPPCPQYQQPNCAAIAAAIAQSAAAGTAVDSSNWTTNAPPSTPAPVPVNPVPAQTPQPTPSANAPSIVPASAVTPPPVASGPPVPQQPSGPVGQASSSDTLFGLPAWAVIGITAVGAFFIFGGHR